MCVCGGGGGGGGSISFSTIGAVFNICNLKFKEMHHVLYMMLMAAFFFRTQV